MTITTRSTLIAVFVSVLTFVALLAPAMAQASGPHFYTNLVKLEEGVREPITSYGHLTWCMEGCFPVECEIAAGGYVENPVGGGPGKEMTEAFDAYDCHNTECEFSGDHIGVIFENDSAPGLRNQINWPGELTEAKAGTIRLKMSNVAEYAHCQFAYTAPSERPVAEGPFKGTEERDTAEYNEGTEVTCTTRPPGLWQPRETSGTSPAKPAETENDSETGKLECGLFKLLTAGKLANVAYNIETNVPSVIETKKE